MLNYVVIQLGYMTQVSICAKYVAIQLHQETKQTKKKQKNIKLAEFLPPSQQVLRLQLLLLIVSHNCFENSFAGAVAYKTQWMHMVMSYHSHAQSNNTTNRYGTSDLLHHPGASLSE